MNKQAYYHGSPLKLDELSTGSTITPWKELAMAFSHKPSKLSIDDDNKISHNGQIYPTYLYIIDEEVVLNLDIYQHPRSFMGDGFELLTKRPLKLKLIEIIDK